MDRERKEKYFRRLGLTLPDSFTPDGGNLKKLHRFHSMIIPYDNTDYLRGDILPTDPEVQFREIIEGRRGGMCLDINTLFAELLRELGYQVRLGATKVFGAPEGNLNGHVVFEAVDCEGVSWWCDAANPFITFPEPVRMCSAKTDSDASLFRCEIGQSRKPEIWGNHTGVWEKRFELMEWDITLSDTNEAKFGDPSRYPENPVFIKEIFSLVTPFGRKSLTGNVYRESIGDKLIKYECGEEMMQWAYEQFGLGERRRNYERIL